MDLPQKGNLQFLETTTICVASGGRVALSLLLGRVMLAPRTRPNQGQSPFHAPDMPVMKAFCYGNAPGVYVALNLKPL